MYVLIWMQDAATCCVFVVCVFDSVKISLSLSSLSQSQCVCWYVWVWLRMCSRRTHYLVEIVVVTWLPYFNLKLAFFYIQNQKNIHTVWLLIVWIFKCAYELLWSFDECVCFLMVDILSSIFRPIRWINFNWPIRFGYIYFVIGKQNKTKTPRRIWLDIFVNIFLYLLVIKTNRFCLTRQRNNNKKTTITDWFSTFPSDVSLAFFLGVKLNFLFCFLSLLLFIFEISHGTESWIVSMEKMWFLLVVCDVKRKIVTALSDR